MLVVTFGVGEVYFLSQLVSIINGSELNTFKTIWLSFIAVVVLCSTVSNKTTNNDNIYIIILRVSFT